MIRTIIKPQHTDVLIQVPEEYIGKEIEVIAFKTEEATTGNQKTETHFASEKMLAKDWLTPEEDSAWKDL